jgi:hypothetical protein
MIMDRRVVCGGFSTPTMVSENHCIPTLHDGWLSNAFVYLTYVVGCRVSITETKMLG